MILRITILMEIRGFGFLKAGAGKGTFDSRTSSYFRNYFQFPSQKGRAKTHQSQPQPAIAAFRQFESPAVVNDLQQNFVAALFHFDFNPVRTPMPDRIVDGLLGDKVNLDAVILPHVQFSRSALDLTIDPVQAGRLARKFVHGADDFIGIEFQGAQASRDLAGLIRRPSYMG